MIENHDLGGHNCVIEIVIKSMLHEYDAMVAQIACQQKDAANTGTVIKEAC